MAKFLNRVKMTVTGTPGTGTDTLNAAFSNAYATVAEAGGTNGSVYSYVIEDGNDFEVGIGTYTSAGTTFSRDTVRLSKISGASGTTKLTLTSSAVVFLSPLQEDLLSKSDTQTANQIYAGPSSGSAAAPAFRTLAAADIPNGGILQCLQTTYTTNTALGTAIPWDDTTPLSTEGVQVLSQAITPTDNTNKILCFVSIWGGDNSGVASSMIGTLFRGSTLLNVGAIADPALSASIIGAVNIVHLDSPATTSSTTYSVRAANQGTTARLNGNTSGRFFGGASACTLTLMEVAA